MEEQQFGIRISERTNQQVDITTSDWSVHWHESIEIQYVVEGAVTYFCNNRYETLGPGDVLFAGWCVPHTSMDFVDGTRYYVIQFYPTVLFNGTGNQQLSKYVNYLTVSANELNCFIRQDAALTGLLRSAIEAYTQQSFGWELGVYASLLGVISRMIRCHSRISGQTGQPGQGSSLACTRRVMSYLFQHQTEAVSLDQMAQELGLSKSYICSCFRKHTGKTVVNYLNEFRCHRAIALLRSGNSITQAASSVGFSDHNYFSRVFKKAIGQSPSAFLRRLHNAEADPSSPEAKEFLRRMGVPEKSDLPAHLP